MKTPHLSISGVYPPVPTFFDEQENLDLDTLRRHIRRLREQQVNGYVVMGSNGEAVHLTNAERGQVTTAAREAAGQDAQVLVGCGDQTTRATIEHCEQAAHLGADAALVLPPFYYKSCMHPTALIAHYSAVAAASPIPILIYNMPANSGGLDLDAATICTLAEHANIIGVKDSAGNIVKLAQIVEIVARRSLNREHEQRFSVLAGSASYLLPALAVGASGVISALANIFPREVCAIIKAFQQGMLDEAKHQQARLIPANTAVTSMYSIAGLKAALEITAGYGGRPRLPVQPLSAEERAHLTRILEEAR